MWHIGAVLFGIGLLMISPLDEIFILLPLSAVVGLWVFPLSLMIGLFCLIVGGFLLGKHILPLLSNPIFLLCFVAGIIILVYLIVSEGWLTEYLKYI